MSASIAAIITTSALAFALPNQAFAECCEGMQIFVKTSHQLHVTLNVEEAEITHEIQAVLAGHETQAGKVLAGHEEELGKIGSMSLGGGRHP